MLIDFIKHCLTAQNEHDIHSPFLFDYYSNVIKNKSLPELKEIEQLKKRLRESKDTIEIADLGAGSKIYKNNVRSIGSIAKRAHRSKYWVKVLAHTAKYMNSKIVVELGTSLGLTTAYLSKYNPHAKIYTFEGCPSTLKIAEHNFKKLDLYNIVPLLGNIDQSLPHFINQIERLDFVLFDANHRLAPTLSYFEYCLTKAHEQSVFIFDDIYWSKEMREAWNTIKKHPRVSMSLDFYHLGMLFFDKSLSKQSFKLRS